MASCSKKKLRCGNAEVLISDEVLGLGSYAIVYKAKNGRMPCAAKMLHETLFQDDDPGTCVLIKRFKQECELLTAISHPNIVAFLGSLKDPQSGRLILLMELLDDCLTRFLERLITPLPYHIQLNICHDIADALSYLHSIDIIHRDLSSNNILLAGNDPRVKVADLGMSRLTDMNARMTPLTQCPGTTPYMPPEALIKPPCYSSKLDCFSFGVLTIQIITRIFPNPGDAVRSMEIDDPRFPTCVVYVPIPETERRKKDISQIESDHSLLPIAHHCIKDRHIDRPSSDEVCERLRALKKEMKYIRSGQLAYLERYHLDEVKKITEGCFISAREVDKVDPNVKTITMKEAWRTLSVAPQPMSSSSGAIVTCDEMLYLSQGYNVYSFSSTKNKWDTLQQCRYRDFSMAIVNEMLTTIGGVHREVTNSLLSLQKSRSWKEHFPRMPTSKILPATVTTSAYLVVAGGKASKNDFMGLSKVEVFNATTYQWLRASSLPFNAISPQIAFCGKSFYLSTVHNGTTTVFSCTLSELISSCKPNRSVEWSRLANLPSTHKTSLISVSSTLLAIGDDIHYYDTKTKKWSKTGQILTPRHTALTAVLPHKEIIVVGGHLRGQLSDVTEIGLVV